MATNYGLILPTPHSFVACTGILKWTEDCTFDLRIFNGNDFCKNLVTFDSVTMDIARVEIATFGTIAKNWLFPPNISEITGPILTKFSVSRSVGADDKSDSDIRFVVVQGTLL